MNDLKDIGFYTLSDDRVRQISSTSPLWRCEIIITDNCNFKCPYCRSNDNSKAHYNYQDIENVLALWCHCGLKNVRFSGGEPTLHPVLNRMISYAKRHNVERIAISSNGSMKRRLYEDLLKMGVNDFSISLDACCASYGDNMAGGIDGAWNRVVENIKFLSKESYVTVGMVFNEINISQAKESILFAHELGVADIRVITAAQYGESCDILKDIPDEILDCHPILKYRVNNAKDNIPMRGLNPQSSNRCHLVLDDMAVKEGYHYPCIIYLREGGNPIGHISDNFRKQRLDWSTSHDCHNDDICKKNCLDVCRDYNIKARYYDERKPKAKENQSHAG